MWQQHSDPPDQLSLYFLHTFHTQLMISHIFHGPWRLEAQWLCAPSSCSIGHGATGWCQVANKSNSNSFFSSSSWNQKELGPGFWAHFTVSMETSYAFPERKVLVFLGLEMMGKRETGSSLSEILCVRLLHVPHITRWDPGRSWKCEIEAC